MKIYNPIQTSAAIKAKLSLLVISFSPYFVARIRTTTHVSPAVRVPQAHGPAPSPICTRKAIASMIRNTIQVNR